MERFDYPALVRGSLLGMVRGLIERVAEEGFPGDHSFLITFATSEPGVEMSARLRKRYPDEMTIVLQHQFWNLRTTGDAFEVTLRFGGTPEPLTVPWVSLRAFADPSADFGLRLQVSAEPEAAVTAPEKEADEEQHLMDQSPENESTKDAGPEAEAVDSEASDEPLKPSSNVLAFGAHRRRVDTSS